MIHRYYKAGQKLDVSGLNQITVLVDRSETELTEIGLNEWRAGLEGPPHQHAAKDQIFYIVSGEGVVSAGPDHFPVSPGSLVYIPAGILHKTEVKSEIPLGYILFNVFSDFDKEGHASFADHIKKVKEVRRSQADTGQSDVDGAEKLIKTDKNPKFFKNTLEGKVYDFGSNSTILLLDRTETNRCEFVVVRWPVGNKGPMVAHKEKEQTFFVLSGTGKVTVANETGEVKQGDVIFVPRNTPHITEAGDTELVYLCLNSMITESGDASFEEMYQRIAPGRIERWKREDHSVGE
jgi:quercetin dioxygenase-like cupin family protein